MTNKFDYEKCNPINGRKSTAWKVVFEDGEERILILDVGFIDKPKEIINLVSAHNQKRKFYITPITVGSFVISKTIDSFSFDGRFVDSDFKSGLQGL